MGMVNALVIRTAGTNCDREMVRALELAGARPSLVHADRLIEDPQRLEEFDLIAFPGGFSYGDDIASGRILAVRFRQRLYPALRSAAERGCPMIGVCNGFQILVQIGLLPGPTHPGAWPPDKPPTQETTLTVNASGRFIDDWTPVRTDPRSNCIWTKNLNDAFPEDQHHDVMRLPIAHGEGRFVAASPEVLDRLDRAGQIPLRYTENPNGSQADAAGICDVSGRIFGLMPHPERYVEWSQHPFWTRLGQGVRARPTPGMIMFTSAVEAAASPATAAPIRSDG